MPRFSHACCGLALALTVLFADPGVAQSGNPAGAHGSRISGGLSSPAQVMEKLEHVVGKLANEQKAWDDQLFPSIDVFLIGLDQKQPVGADLVFDKEEERGVRKQFHIPIDKLTDFLNDNLAPIDINAKSKGKDKTYYELDSPTLEWHGFMRLKEKYASISSRETDVPATMVSPKTGLTNLLNKGGYDAAARLDNTGEGTADRQQAFTRYRDDLLTRIQKRTNETDAEYQLRRGLAEQQLDRLGRLFVQSREMHVGWTTDIARNEVHADLKLAALAGTDLAALVNKIGSEGSYFSAIPTTTDAVLSGRVNLAVDDFLQKQLDTFYDLSLPVWRQKLSEREKATPEQTATRQQILDLFVGMLREGKQIGKLDGCIEVSPIAGGKHNVLFGIRAADGTKAIEILKLIPKAVSDWQVALDADQQGQAAIHKITFGKNSPEAIKKFYGGAGEVFVATSTEAVWISGGENALARLKDAIGLVEKSTPTANGVVLDANMRLGPTLTHLDELAREEGFDLEEWLGRKGARPDDGKGKKDGEEGKRRPAQALAGFDWRGVALPVLKDAREDRLQLLLKKDASGEIQGTGRIEKDVLKAAGKVIARIAVEKLGS